MDHNIDTIAQAKIDDMARRMREDLASAVKLRIAVVQVSALRWQAINLQQNGQGYFSGHVVYGPCGKDELFKWLAEYRKQREEYRKQREELDKRQ